MTEDSFEHRGLILATLCDMILGENAPIRSDDELVRGVRKMINALEVADDTLALVEDTGHGCLRENITAARGEISKVRPK